MNYLGVGDLATSLSARRSNSILKTEFARLTQELATGRKANASEATGGDTSSLTSIEHLMSLLDAYGQAQMRISQKLNHAEISLDTIDAQISDFGPTLLANTKVGGIAVDAVLHGASTKFHAVASAFSVRVGGAYIFSGDTPDTPPLVGSETILNELKLATAGAVTASDFYQRVDDWFNQPGGFDVAGYSGGQAPTHGVSISATDKANFTYTAQEAEFRTILKDLAITALVEQNGFLGNDDDRTTLIQSAASGLISAQAGLTLIRANVGAAQASVVAAEAQNGFQANSLAELSNDLTGVDLFETASRFEEIQLQLESLYLTTAKSARLTLTEYLR